MGERNMPLPRIEMHPINKFTKKKIAWGWYLYIIKPNFPKTGEKKTCLWYLAKPFAENDEAEDVSNEPKHADLDFIIIITLQVKNDRRNSGGTLPQKSNRIAI